MPNDKPGGIVKVDPPPQTGSRIHISAEDLVPHRAVEVVTDEEIRHEEQIKPQADLPRDFFKRIPNIKPPAIPYATVSCETMLGFLAAIEKIIPIDSNYPILSSAKINYAPDVGRLYLEAGSPAVWTVIGIRAQAGSDRGFSAMLPVRRAKNVLTVLRDQSPNVIIGVDEEGICLGPHTVPFGGLLEDFPGPPAISDWIARAGMPAFYFREICSRVLPAKSADFRDALSGALMDFESYDYDGVSRTLCTVVASDDARLHILRLPQLITETRPSHLRALPPTCTVSAGFFQYMQEIVQHEWVGLELGVDQVVARGEDFIVVAKAAIEGKTSTRGLTQWRKINVDFAGYWLAPIAKLTQLIKAALDIKAEEGRLRINGLKDELSITASNTHGDRLAETIQVRNYDGASAVDITVSLPYLADALAACSGGLVRLGFTKDLRVQATSPMVLRGEDEQFKAILMPRTQTGRHRNGK